MSVSFKLRSNKKKSSVVQSKSDTETKLEPVTEIVPMNCKRLNHSCSKHDILALAPHKSIEEAVEALPDAPTETDYELLSIDAFGDLMRTKMAKNEKRRRR